MTAITEEQPRRLAVIGGHERGASLLADTALAAGYELELHPGNVHGRGADELRRVIARADLVVILTEINSHGGVFVAKSAARQLGKPTLIMRRLGPARLRGLIEALDARQERRDQAPLLFASGISAH
jgi:hypothetical protein